jgi:hypothetical protein
MRTATTHTQFLFCIRTLFYYAYTLFFFDEVRHNAYTPPSFFFQYRYCIIDPKGSGVFEREPNRVISMLPGTARTTLSAHASLGIAASVQPNTNEKPFRQV